VTRADWRAAWRRVREDWPGKVAAVLAASVLWWVASSDPGTTSQRSLLVPLEVTGAAADEVAVGVPGRVEVVITGPSDRMDRLDADDVDAVLDLADVDGEFARDVDARVPQALRVVRVVPAEVIGRLEAVRSVDLPIRPLVALPEDGRVAVSLEVRPARAAVEARDPILSRVAEVIAPLAAPADGEREVVLVAVDEDGVPVPEARVVPATARVRVLLDAATTTVTRPVAAVPPGDAATVEALRPETLTLVGPPAALADLAVVTARVPDATSALPPGRYDLPVRLDLPPGVAAHATVVATVRVTASAPADDADPAPAP
jgi:YbbR domain-containing protein